MQGLSLIWRGAGDQGEEDDGMERYTGGAFSFEVTDANATGGDGPEDVAILLHGFPQDRRCWDGVTSLLTADGYRVLAPDLRGYSAGARPWPGTGPAAIRGG